MCGCTENVTGAGQFDPSYVAATLTVTSLSALVNQVKRCRQDACCHHHIGMQNKVSPKLTLLPQWFHQWQSTQPF
jgi:hypothetical protein